MIEIKNLTKKFGNKTAISNLTIDIDKGLIGLVGHNGAGKSTLFRLISGVYQPTEGEILIDGNASTTKAAKEKIFFLPDDPYAPAGADIKETFNFYNTFYDIDIAKFNSLIKAFNLPWDKKVRVFSKGMRRLLFIALTLSVNCEILLMDEAFDGLDPVVLETVKYHILKIYEENRTIVLSSHNVSALEKLVDKFIVIHEGRLSGDGSLDFLGETFEKYQALFNKECSEETLKNHGLKIISYRKMGSIYNFVIVNQNRDDVAGLLADLEPTLLENIPIDANEIILLQMLSARKEDQQNERI